MRILKIIPGFIAVAILCQCCTPKVEPQREYVTQPVDTVRNYAATFSDNQATLSPTLAICLARHLIYPTHG
ncbi:MAG: hypothetical protein LUC85_08610 [Bacteroidales bacterium]|nr:hypothetical protein [Bacteroidales bacterium]MCD8394876.1 hypothetical protein [Bacteroidales bacterium]